MIRIHLNSIMILLIPTVNIRALNTVPDLNSIMILLIQT